MKARKILPYAALLTLTISGCEKQSAEITRKVAELERKNQQAEDRQRELEQQLQDQMIATERDAIERERARIEDDRAELERQKGDAAAEQDEALRKREQEIANREGKLEQLQSSLDQKEDDLGSRDQELSERDREVAGREALAFDSTEQSVPVADYGTFYDSLSSYGSWFETPNYGYVWQPAVVRDSNWRPYSRGRWVCSDRGWAWVSDEPFGWATYHYGRWALIAGRGWIWVPGSEWAPCWVSWRENSKCIGWAPLPPETLAWRGHHWDNTVDVRFGIGAGWFNFVEISNFGSSVYSHCLPLSGNSGWYGDTTNITYIHIQNQQVICGGPRYKYLCDRIGKRLPFCRLEIDHHPKSVRDPFVMRPDTKGGKLRFSAPNMDVAWNDGLRPKQVRGRIEEVRVQRDVALSTEITDKFRSSREESRQRADKSIADMGGRERFEETRVEQLNQNRRLVDPRTLKVASGEVARNPDRANPGGVVKKDGPHILPPPPGSDKVADRQGSQSGSTGVVREDRNRVAVPQPRVDGPHVVPPAPNKNGSGKVGSGETARVDSGVNRGQERVNENKRQDLPTRIENKDIRFNGGQDESQARENQKRDQQAREEQASRNKQMEDARQRQAQLAQQAKEAQETAQRRMNMEQAQLRKQQDDARRQQAAQEEARRQQQENARQRQAEESARQQRQAEDSVRQQRQAQESSRQQEQARQRQQEESQRQQQQEQNRQRQQEQQQQQQQEQNRQRQQEQSRQQQDERGKRNR